MWSRTQKRAAGWLAAVLISGTQTPAKAQQAVPAPLARAVVTRPQAARLDGQLPLVATRGHEHEPRGAARLLRAASVPVERGKTVFLTQVRVPVAKYWNGRVRLSGIEQRVRYAPWLAILSQANCSLAAGSLQWGNLPRGRSNYGLSLTFHFGRQGPGARPLPAAGD